MSKDKVACWLIQWVISKKVDTYDQLYEVDFAHQVTFLVTKHPTIFEYASYNLLMYHEFTKQNVNESTPSFEFHSKCA